MGNDNNKGMKVEEPGELYSEDGKVLLKCPNLPRYQIREGCERVDDKAFGVFPAEESLCALYIFG